MFRLTRVDVALGLTVALIAVEARGADVTINNGLAPPNPANVLDDATHSADRVYVRNVGCVAADPCPSPGAATAVEVPAGGQVQDLAVDDTSSADLTGGTISSIVLVQGSSSVSMSGGSVGLGLLAVQDASVTVSAGSVGSQIGANGASTVTFSGGTTPFVTANHDATLIVSGGTASTAAASDSARLELQSGTVNGDVTASNGSTVVGSGASVTGSVTANDSSTLLWEGGTVDLSLVVNDAASATLQGGLITGPVNVSAFFVADSTARFTILGGAIGGGLRVSARDGGAEVRGGLVSGDLVVENQSYATLSGGSVGGMLITSGVGSTLAIVGRNFELDGSPVPYGELAATTGVLTGLLAFGDPLGKVIDNQGTILLVAPPVSPVPLLQPLGQLLLGALLLGAGYGRARRHHRA